MIHNNFQNSIRAQDVPTYFATRQTELCRVVDYNRKWSVNFHVHCMFENYLIVLSRRLLMIFIIFKIVLWPTAFAILQIELCRVKDYHRKLLANFHENCVLENYFI